MDRVTKELWQDLAAADAMGDEELAQTIAERIKEIEGRGLGTYALDSLERLGDVPVGLGEVGLQAATGVANRIAPESGVARYMTDAADNFTSARQQLAAERDARMEGDTIGQATGAITDIGSYFLPSGVTRGAVSTGTGALSRVAQNTARDVTDVTAQTLARAGRDPENLEENLEADAILTAALSGGLNTAGAGLRQLKGGMSRAGGLLDQSPAGRAAEEAAARRGVTDAVRGEDLMQNQALRNLARGGGEIVDQWTGRGVRNLQRQKEAFLDDAGAGIDDALDQDFVRGLGTAFVRKYKEIRQMKNRLYNAANEELDPLLGKLDMNTRGKNPDTTTFKQKLGQVMQEIADTQGLKSPAIKTIKDFALEPAKFSVWANRRRQLNRKIRQMSKSSDPDWDTINAYKEIRKALDKQLDEWAGKNNSWRKANQYYRKFYKPYKTNHILKKIESKDPDEGLRGDLVAEKMLSSKDPRDFDLDTLFGALDEDGVQTAYRAMIQRVKNAATRDDKNVEIPWSSARAATELKNMAERLRRAAPNKETRQAIDDWEKIFRASEQVSMDVARSPTGRSLAQMAGPAAGLGIMGSVTMGDPAPALIGMAPLALALAVRSPRVRATMRKMADMDKAHPDYKALEERLATLVSRATAGGTEE